MKKDIKAILEQIGLNPIEIKTYLATLEMGPDGAAAIASSAGLNRITAYEALKRLSKRGLIRIRAKRNTSVRYFEAEPMSVIEEKLNEQKSQIDETIGSIAGLKAEFAARYARRPEKPDVLFYEGEEGIKNALQDTLAQKPDEILSFASADSLEEGFTKKFLESYWRRRTELKIPSRGIVPKTQRALDIFTAEKNSKELRRIKLLPKELKTFNNEIDIYGDNVAIISLVKNQEHAVIIRSKTIAQSLRSLFEVFWEMI